MYGVPFRCAPLCPVFIEESDPAPLPIDNAAAKVAWQKPAANNINHRDHQRVHATLAAEHLDIAAGYARSNRGPFVTNHVAAAAAHNEAGKLHVKADDDADFVPAAVKASTKAYTRSRRLLRPEKTTNMVAQASQSADGAAALKAVKAFNPALAPEALEVRQWKRARGEDDNF